MRSLIDISELTTGEIEELIGVANDIIANPEKYSEKCRGKKLATLFFEPSTRTRLSGNVRAWRQRFRLFGGAKLLCLKG